MLGSSKLVRKTKLVVGSSREERMNIPRSAFTQRQWGKSAGWCYEGSLYQ